jgi:hypothetical protein
LILLPEFSADFPDEKKYNGKHAYTRKNSLIKIILSDETSTNVIDFGKKNFIANELVKSIIRMSMQANIDVLN